MFATIRPDLEAYVPTFRANRNQKPIFLSLRTFSPINRLHLNQKLIISYSKSNYNWFDKVLEKKGLRKGIYEIYKGKFSIDGEKKLSFSFSDAVMVHEFIKD